VLTAAGRQHLHPQPIFLRTAAGGEDSQESKYLDDNKLIQKVSGKSFAIDYTIKSVTNKKKMDGTLVEWVRLSC